MIKFKNFALNPILFNGNGWYFYDESWANIIGPFYSYMECVVQLLDYCDIMNKRKIYKVN